MTQIAGLSLLSNCAALFELIKQQAGRLDMWPVPAISRRSLS